MFEIIAIQDPALSLTYSSVSNYLIILSFREENAQFQMNKNYFLHVMALLTVIKLSERLNENDTKNVILNSCSNVFFTTMCYLFGKGKQ